MTAVSIAASLFDAIAGEAAGESELWADVVLSREERRPVPIFSTLCEEERFHIGIESIYEGYLAHYGCPRLFAIPDGDTALLLGDYLYAHGLVRIASTGSVAAVHDLAELISLCAQIRAEGRSDDDAAWAATAARLARGGLERARAALRERGDPRALLAAAAAAAGHEAVERARSAHALQVG